jgi:uncharacterized membrane protein
MNGHLQSAPYLCHMQNLIVHLHPIKRILIGLGLAGVTYVLTEQAKLAGLLKLMLLWDVFALVYVLLCWIIFFAKDAYQIRQNARKEDGSRTLVSILIIVASFASMTMVTLMVLSKEIKESAIYVPVAVAGILLSWVMVHTIFTIHYANLYYDDDVEDSSRHAGGLEFPGKTPRPTYLDFAYFSFVIGMTFQVSDVEISSHKLRRVALLHGLLSFVLNTFVVALTINLIAGLKQ